MPLLISREKFKKRREDENFTMYELFGPEAEFDSSVTREVDYAPRFVYNRTKHPFPKRDSEAHFEQERMNGFIGIPDGWMIELNNNYDFELSIGEIRALQNYRIKKKIEPLVRQLFSNRCCLTGRSFCTILDPISSHYGDQDLMPLDPEHYILIDIKLAEAYRRKLFWFDANGRLTLDEYTSIDEIEYFKLDTSLLMPADLSEKTKKAFFIEIK